VTHENLVAFDMNFAIVWEWCELAVHDLVEFVVLRHPEFGLEGEYLVLSLQDMLEVAVNRYFHESVLAAGRMLHCGI
jgi:hypothetical protein